MKTKHFFTFAVFLLLILAGCTRASTPPAPTVDVPQIVASTDTPASTDVPAPTDPTGLTIAPYAVDINPTDFVAVMDNPYFPAIPGTKYVYEGQTADGLERIEIEVLAETRKVSGVTTTVIRDTVYLDGVLIEDTLDWYAQDKEGTVWYFGEDVDNYENGQLKDHAGSWEAGVDGALPGIYMFADPASHVGETYYQEYYAGEAEDQAELLSASESVTIGYGSFENVVQTYDFTALDPDSQEQKFYAAGIGSIKTVNLKTGETFELIEYAPGGIVSGAAGEPYTIDVTPADFVAVVDNPYFPLTPGSTKVFEGMVEDGLERIEIKVLSETHEVMGIQATIRQDTVYIGGELVEDTFDWFAQDKAGNVWYLGEDVKNYENGQLKDNAGSWEAGVDGALPGIIMYAGPAAHLGETYYQEYFADEAEDAASLLSASESITVAAGSFENVVKTFDFTPLEAVSLEHKYYAAGAGVIKNVNLTTGVVFELIEYTTGEAASTVELLPQPTSGFPPGFVPNEAGRVDIAKPVFSNPTSITNPLLPITEVDQLIQLGLKDGLPHRTEFTLLPGIKTITWNGEQTEVRILQFVSYLDGRVLEHALDFLAQADGGAVWYFGEDVYNYENGVVVDRDGTWLAGKDGPPAMIMPALPQIGNVYRVENIPGNVFEEVMVLATHQTLEGPRGLIEGVMFVQQIGLDGKTTLKAFAPGYGEFLAHSEDAGVAVPIDLLSDPLPAELETLLTGASSIFDVADLADWDTLSATLATMPEAWEAHQANVDLGSLFPLLDIQMARSLASLTSAIEQQNREATRDAAFDVAVATLDFQLPYRPRVEIDLVRFDLWTRRVIADSAAGNPGHVAGDVVILEFIWQRISHTVEASTAQAIDAQLAALRAAADAEDLEVAADAARQLLDLLARLTPTGN